MIDTVATPGTLSEGAAAEKLGIHRATLRYYRTKGYLTAGLVVEPPEGTFRGRTSPIHYDVATLEKIVAGELHLTTPDADETPPATPELRLVEPEAE